MPTKLTTVVVEASDPLRLAHFWAQTLEWEPTADGRVIEGPLADGTGIRPRGAGDVGLLFVPSVRPKTAKNRVHLDLAGDADEVQRLLALGATCLDIGQGAVPWEVLADPEGNEFCVLPRADAHGRLAQICQDAADPSRQGRFWAEASGWSLVDEGDWGVSLASGVGDGPTLVMGPPVAPKTSPNRIRLALTASADSDPSTEVNRLLDAGASPVDIDREDAGRHQSRRQPLLDPEGNEFLLLGPSQAEQSGAGA
ncbi:MULTISPECIES: VOC family protein [Streptomyces]|uniref:VOC family protein n=1 Tax=Streptomyces siderophoricus TaxID=2802281 RepID=A0ABS1MJB5_9ACTN|nr:VOC family protein [Streptomyces sp. 9-7]MBL1088159.1 VOC family protein [Streptomyces sp. 9-7]